MDRESEWEEKINGEGQGEKRRARGKWMDEGLGKGFFFRRKWEKEPRRRREKRIGEGQRRE